MVNIAVLVSGGGTNLQALLDAQAQGEIEDGHICLVLSNKENAFALERAKKAGVKTAVLTKERAESAKSYGERLVTLLKENQIQLVVLAGFLLILDACVIDAYKNRIVNVHPSLIPAFCGEGYYGLKVHEAALERGVTLTGATVHLVNEIADGGKILAQKAVEVCPGDTPQTLQKRVMQEAEWILLPQEVQKLAHQMNIQEEP